MFALEPWQLLVLFLPALLNLWGIWHALYRVFPTPLERLGWLGLCIFVPFLGGLVYFFVGRRRARTVPSVQQADVEKE